MAEFALGLTKVAVEGTLSLVKSAIDEESKLRVKVQNDLVFITGEFEMMQSFLNIANNERAKNEVVRTWVRQVRYLAFDVEDCIEFVVHLDTKSSWGWWQRLWHKVYCHAPPLPLDEAVAEIKQLKARVDEVSQRNTRYNLISDSRSNPKPVSAAEQPAAATATTGASWAFHILSEVWKESGKWLGMGDLAELINNGGQDLQVISVWGCREADDVTSTIFRKVYDGVGICQEFKRRAWIKLKQPFTLSRFLENLQTQFHWTSHQANEDVGNLTMAELMQQVKEHKYLIILEEVSSVVEWDAIRKSLPDSKNGSRIVLSTKQLGIALRCTGAPNQVSELVRFSDDQSLCAISKTAGRRSGKGQLIWQMSCRGVISVRGNPGDTKSTVVHKVFTRIMHKASFASSGMGRSMPGIIIPALYRSVNEWSGWKWLLGNRTGPKSEQCQGVEFKRHSWVNVPNPFNLEDFSRRLLMNFRTDDLQAEEIAAVGMMTDPSLITQECWKILHEEDCLVVIDGLQSTHDWDLIKAAFISEPIRGCIVVITNDESVAAHCSDDEDAALSVQDLEADPVLRSLINVCQHYGIEGLETSRRGRSLSIRREEARQWFKEHGGWGPNGKLIREQEHGVSVASLWGPDCAWKSDIVREVYYREILFSECSVERMDTHRSKKKRFTMFSWVDVHHPFNLTDFSRRLLLDFYSDDLQAKRTAAVGMMEGEDPIQGCCKFLREYECLVVIDGLLTKHEWNMIKAAFLSEPANAHIIVITNEDTLATYVVSEEHLAFNIHHLQAETAVRPLIKGCASRLFSDRSEEAREWIDTFALVGNQAISAMGFPYIKTRDQNPGVISVWGIAGVGKSALVRSIYFHALLGVWQNFMNGGLINLRDYSCMWGTTMYSWVDVPHPFNLAELCCRLLVDSLSDDMQAKEAAAVGIVEGRQDPIYGCRRMMHEQKCFIVFDGLRSTDDWDMIKATLLPDGTKAQVVVIANEETVATYCVDNKKDQVVNVQGLEPDSALDLFTKITWGCKDLTPMETMLSERFIAKCGGILKVIVAIGNFFAKEIADLKEEFWHNPHQLARNLLDSTNCEFMGILEKDPKLFQSLRGLFAWMQTYFDACPDSLKPCVFYMCIFPAKHSIRRRRLLRRWIAEGYSRDTSGRVAEENGERLFSELVNLSIIQQTESEIVFFVKECKGMCQVNGFFHEYIISRPMEDNLVFALEGHCSLNSQHAGQHLTIRSSWDRDEIVFKGIDFSRLRSMTVFGEWKSFLVSENMLLLRVLDLEDALYIRNDDLEHIAKVMPRLKFLSLRGHKEICHLPDSLSSLRQLQTLDVKHTSVVRLPPGIIKLHKLQYVRAGTALKSDEGDDVTAASLPTEDVDHQTSTRGWSGPRTLVSSWLSMFQKRQHGNGGVKVPAGIGNLTALHTLGVIDVNVAGAKARVKEIKKLTQLRKLGISGISRDCWPEFCSAISCLAHLWSLSVKADKDREGPFAIFGDNSQPPKALEILKVYGHVQILPVWLIQPHHLRKTNVGLTILTQQDITDHSKVHNLNLFFSDLLCVKPIQDCQLTFDSACQTLEIECTSRLSVTFVVNAFTMVVKVHCSSGSSLWISGLKNLNYLKEVWLNGSYADELKQDLQRQIDEHPKKPVLKLEWCTGVEYRVGG